MRTFILSSLLLSTSAFSAPTADIAILLDTSGSMQGLINQVRDGIWQTLNNLGDVQRDGQKAKVRLALYEYGSGVVTAEANHLQMLVPLTSDHTKIAERLFSLKAQGSQEYSGLAIESARENLGWSSDSLDFKSIVIAGNETIFQGTKDPIEAAKEASQNGFHVNTIFAGSQTQMVFNGGGNFGCAFCNPLPNPTPTPSSDPQLNPIFKEWRDMAKAGNGEALNIDHNNSMPYIESPFDDQIVKTTEKINDTFLPFGTNGQAEYNRMLNLDRQIRGSGNGSYMDWGSYRGGSFGSQTNASWDLVTAIIQNPGFDLGTIKEEHLPEQLRGKPLVEKLKIVQSFVQKRKALEKELEELREKRQEFVEAELEEREGDQAEDFSGAIRKILVKQLEEKGFEL